MIQTLLTEIAESGWLFNNCYQLDDGSWRVNLRRPGNGSGEESINWSGDWFTDWAMAPTFAEALAECMNKLATAEFEEDHKPSHSIDVAPILVQNSLLAGLGLLKPRQPLRRL